MKKSPATQQMVNGFPEWSSVRRDEQSLGYQVTNSVAINLEDLQKQLQRAGDNYHLSTVNLDEIDIVHRLDLGSDFEFDKTDEDSSQIDYIVPTVSGRLGSDWHKIVIASGNDIETFWETSIPTRYSIATTDSGSCTVLPPTITSGVSIDSFSNDPHLDGKLYVTIEGGSKFIRNTDNEIVRGTVQLTGTTRKDTEETETMIFLYNDTQITKKEWKSLEKVSVYGIDEFNEYTIGISSCNFNAGPYLDFYNIDWSEGDNKVDTFWNVSTTQSGINTLDMIRFVTDDFTNIVIAQITDKEVVSQIELLDKSGQIIDEPLDMAIQPFSDRCWVVTSGYLYLYDLNRPYPDMGKMTKKQYDSYVKINVDNYHKVIHEDVELTYRLARPIVDIAKHRVSIEFPDGSKYAIIDGILTPLTASLDYWQFGVINETILRHSDIITLNQRGDYIVTLEAIFSDNTRHVDQRIVSVDSKKALTALNLPFSDAIGVHFDSDQRLWVLDSSGVHHRVDLATDVMLVDFQNKTIFLHEEYDEVLVES